MKAKSKAVRQLISFIHSSPDVFRANDRYGFESQKFKITFTGNTRVLSIVHLKMDGKDSPLSYRDKWALEAAALWWFKHVPLNEYA